MIPFKMMYNMSNLSDHGQYSKNPHKRTTIFRGQAGKGSHLTGHFA